MAVSVSHTSPVKENENSISGRTKVYMYVANCFVG